MRAPGCRTGAGSSLLQYLLALVRSLLPSRRIGKLTGSELRFDVVGTPGLAGVSLSGLLQPDTPYSRWVARLKARSWIFNGAWYIGLACYGYVVTALVILVRWPVRNPFGVAGLAALILAFAVLGVRPLRSGWRQLAASGADGPGAPPAVAPQPGTTRHEAATQPAAPSPSRQARSRRTRRGGHHGRPGTLTGQAGLVRLPALTWAMHAPSVRSRSAARVRDLGSRPAPAPAAWRLRGGESKPTRPLRPRSR